MFFENFPFDTIEQKQGEERNSNFSNNSIKCIICHDVKIHLSQARNTPTIDIS